MTDTRPPNSTAQSQKDLNVNIRQMLYQDVPLICSFQKDFSELNWSEESFYKEVMSDKSTSLVATKEDKVLGYIIAKRVIDEAQILNLFVQKDYRRKGIGYLLLGEMLNRLLAHGVLTVFIETRKSNQPAISLYENFGFRQVAVRRDYYVNPSEEGILMTRSLKFTKNLQKIN